MFVAAEREGAADPGEDGLRGRKAVLEPGVDFQCTLGARGECAEGRQVGCHQIH